MEAEIVTPYGRRQSGWAGADYRNMVVRVISHYSRTKPSQSFGGSGGALLSGYIHRWDAEVYRTMCPASRRMGGGGGASATLGRGWLAAEDGLPDPMAGLRPPPVSQKLVPVFTGEKLATLERACVGRTFAQRRDTAIIAVFKATGIRLSELADLRYYPGDPQRSDVDLWQREITVRGMGGKDRIVLIGHQAARSLDRYIRARSRHAQAWKPQLWLGVNNREPLTANGIYQMIARRGRQAGVAVHPHRFRHHFSHTWLDRSGPEGDLMELNGWASPQMLSRYGASARSARAHRTYDRIMDDTP